MKGRLRSFSPAGLKAYQQGVRNASTTRSRQADAWAMSLAPVVTGILAQGYFGLDDLARELEARGCTTRRGGKWSYDLACKLCRRLTNLGIIDHPKEQGRYLPLQRSEVTREGVNRGRRALSDNADDFARSMAPILSSLRAHGYTTYGLLADALNARGIRPQRAERWTKRSVRHLIDRLSEMAKRVDAGDALATGVPAK